MRVLSVDASTKSFAYAIINEGELEQYGQIYFTESQWHRKLSQARKLIEDLVPMLGEIEYIVFEKAVMVRSADVALKLSAIFGVALSVLADMNAKLVEVAPIAWQSGIGNKNVVGEEKRELLAKHPELKTKTQQNTFIRKYRKNRTLDYVEKRSGERMDNDDLGDAVAIGFYMHDKIEDIKDAF